MSENDAISRISDIKMPDYYLDYYSSFSDFFFQAEDGIRDDLVTGVQTCALPIYYPVF